MSDGPVNLMPHHIDGGERTCRTEILAGSAAYALLGVDGRYHKVLAVIALLAAASVTVVPLERHHLYGSGRTMPCAVAALLAVPHRDTVVHHPLRMADLGRGLLGLVNRAYGTGGADLRAFRTLRTAVTPLVGHLRLHHAHQVRSRTQHSVGTHRDAELTSGAMLGKMPETHRSGRHQRNKPVGNDLILDHGQTAVDFLLLSLDRHGCSCHQGGRKETPAGGVDALGLVGFSVSTGCRFSLSSSHCRSCGFLRMNIRNGVLGTVADAVHAGHAAAVVYLVVCDVYAGSLAVALALAAADAPVCVNYWLEPRETGQEAQEGTHRTYCVAPGTAVPPCQHGNQHQHHCGDDERRQTLEPYIRGIEGVAVSPLGYERKQVVDPAVHGSEDVGGNASVGAVRLQQGHKRAHTRNQGDDEEPKHRVTQPALGLRIGVAVLFLLFAQPGKHILHHSERADDGAVHPAEYQSQQH